MRKMLVLLTVAGMFLTAFPELSFAQDATPIVDDPQPTPSEIVLEPTAVPTEPSKEESTPAAKPNASRSNTGFEITADKNTGPKIYIDGQPNNLTAPLGYTVTVTTESGAWIYGYDSTDCSDLENEEVYGSGPTVVYGGFATTASFRAKWTDSPDAPKSDCLTITFEDLSYLVPNLMVNGAYQNATVDINREVNIATKQGAVIHEYTDVDCTDASLVYTFAENPATVAYGKNITRYYKATYQFNTFTFSSDCRSVTWDHLTAPMLTLNGGTEDVLLQVYTFVTIQASEGAQIREHHEAGCTDPANPLFNNPIKYSLAGNFTRYYQAAWPSDPDSPMSDCIGVTWDFLDPPQLLVNGGTNDLQVEVGESVALTTNVGSSIVAYENEGCTGDPFDFIRFQIDVQKTDNHTVYYQSEWYGVDYAPKSDCLQVIWGEGSPVAPTLTLNGEASDATADSGKTITFVTEDFAVLQVFESLDCSGTPTSEVESGFAPSFDKATSISVQAVHKDNETLTSECFTASWNAPAPPVQTPTPTETPVTKTTSITVHMWDGSSIEGAVWNLFAPVASQSITDAYSSGTLGADNNAVLTDIPEGNYVFEVAPAGLDPQRFEITIGPDSQEIVLQFAQPAAPSTPTATTVPGEPTPAPTTAAVSGLPDTGTGSSSSSAVLMLAGLIAASVIIAAFSRRRSATP